MKTLEGKVAFITGAGRGQGRSHAIRLAEDGADIIAVDICAQIPSVEYPLATLEDLEQTAKEVEALGRTVFIAEADVRDERRLGEALTAGIAAVGPVDIVLANAGIAPLSAAENPDVWQDVIDVNLTGVFHTIEVAASPMIERGQGGSIVITSSAAGLSGGGTRTRGSLGYTAAKHGVVGLMRVYANLFAKDSIRVNSVHPSGVNTPMIVNDAIAAYLEEHGRREEGSWMNALPVDMIEPIDVSNAIAWLVSDAARYVTGVTLPVDAGYVNKK